MMIHAFLRCLDHIFRQVFWLPDQFTAHPFPMYLRISGMVGVIPGHSGGPVPEFHRIPFSIILFFFDWVVIKLSSLFDARYLIPIGGMLLGNCLRSLIIGLDQFYSGIKKHEKEYLFTLALYGNQFQALKP